MPVSDNEAQTKRKREIRSNQRRKSLEIAMHQLRLPNAEATQPNAMRRASALSDLGPVSFVLHQSQHKPSEPRMLNGEERGRKQQIMLKHDKQEKYRLLKLQ